MGGAKKTKTAEKGTENKAKKEKHDKSIAQRLEEASNIMTQFSGIGLPDDHPSVVEFKKIVAAYVDGGVSCSGRLKLTGFQRVLRYTFSKQPHIISSAVLEFDPHA